MSSFKADVDTAGYMLAMRRLGDQVLPEVIADTLNQTADHVTRRSLHNLDKRLTVRRKFTTNSLTRGGARPYRALNKAKGRSISRMYSRAGSISPYLGIQDTGGTKRPSRGQRYPIATLNARTGKSYQKSIARRYNLKFMGDLDGSGRFFMGEPKGNQGPLGIYERYQKNHKIRMLRNLDHTEVKIPASNWHSDAVETVGTERMIRSRFKRAATQRINTMRRRR